MASLVCFIRGDKRAVDQFINELSCKYMEFVYEKYDHNKKEFIMGTEEKYHIPISVRYLPLGAWEIVFPKEKIDLCLTTILGKKETNQPKRFDFIKKYIWGLRKLMNLEAIPDYNDENKFPIFNQGVFVMPIGFKQDVTNADGHENL